MPGVRPSNVCCKRWLHDATVLMQWWMRALVLPMCTPYMQLYSPAIRKDFHHNAQIFFCWWINYGRNPQNGKHATTAQFYFSLAHVYFVFSRAWGFEQLSHPLYTINTVFSSHMRYHSITMAIFKVTLQTFITSYYNNSKTFDKMNIHLYMWWWGLE